MTFNLLISCMHETDTNIIGRNNVQSDVVVVNQCDHDSVDEFDFVNKSGRICHAKFINTTERGLSRSRNMAINNAWSDICQICDDDEVMIDGNIDVILNAYEEDPESDVIAFALDRKDHSKVFSKQKCKLGIKAIGQTSSSQITFRRQSVLAKGISFDIKMGSGTGNGGGEENMFLHSCRRAGLKMSYHPGVIAIIQETGNSKWFKGFTDQYFRNLGWATRRIHGFFFGIAYLFMWILTHRSLYTKDNNTSNAIKNLYIGFKEKR